MARNKRHKNPPGKRSRHGSRKRPVIINVRTCAMVSAGPEASVRADEDHEFATRKPGGVPQTLLVDRATPADAQMQANRSCSMATCARVLLDAALELTVLVAAHLAALVLASHLGI
jgi:hypothetical protein